MAKRIIVRGIRRREPDVRLFVQALIELARQQQAEHEAAAKEPASAEERPQEGEQEDGDA